MIHINIDRLLNFSLEVGRMMLLSGGETYRVEDTISTICRSFDLLDVEVFASPTTVMVSIYENTKIYSGVKRINECKTDLDMVHKLNNLSRYIYKNKPSIEFCENKLISISDGDSYTLPINLLFAGIATSSFTILFNAGVDEFIFAFFIGMIIKFILVKSSELKLNEFFIDTICGAIVSILSIICLELNFISELDKLVAGCIMLLVPGLAFTNAIRDLIEGELVSGVTRCAQVFFIGLSIAIGTGSILHFYYNFGGF